MLNLTCFKKFHLKKALAVLLILSLLVTSFSGLFSFAESNTMDGKYWTGGKVQPVNGNGEKASPYLITNGDELAWAISGGGKGKYYKLTADIYLNNPEKINWSTGSADLGYTPKDWWDMCVSFNGSIDGDGHVIYGLYLVEPNRGNLTTVSGRGLIAKANGSAEFKNLGMDNIYIDTNYTAAAFVGVAGTSSGRVKFDNCFVGENATIKGSAAGSFVAYGPCGSPEVGVESYAILDSCYSLAQPEPQKSDLSEVDQKGLLGAMWGSAWEISHCYALTYISRSLNGAVCANNYSATQGTAGNTQVALVTKQNMKGADALSNADKMPNLGSEYKATEGYPVLEVFSPEIKEDKKVWNGKKTKPAEGNGQKATPYLISNGEELAWAIYNKGGQNQYYKLTDDIYLNDTEYINWQTGDVTTGYTLNNWAGSYNAFTGTIDGDGHVIYGLYLTVEKNDTPSLNYGVGLIEKAVGSVEIKNLGMDNVYIDTRYTAAAFVGRAGSASGHGRVKFSNCFVGENATITGSSAGSFVGYGACGAPTDGGPNYLIIDSCYSLAQPVGKVKNATDDYSTAPYCSLTGGMWGTSFEIRNSYAIGYISHSVNANAQIFNNYSAAQGNTDASRIARISKENMQGADALTAATKMPNLGSAYRATNKYPALAVFCEDVPQDDKVWNGTATQPAEGDGQEATPYLISNGAELAWAMQSGGNDKFYKLTADIYLNDLEKIDWATGDLTDTNYIVKYWTPNNFSGTIDGDGHVIYGLCSKDYDQTEGYKDNRPYYCAAFIKRVPADKSATIKNLGFDNFYLHSTGVASVFVGAVTNSATLTISDSYVGANGRIASHTGSSFVSWGEGVTTPNGIYISNCYSLFTNFATSSEDNGFTGRSWRGGNGSISVVNSYAVGKLYYSGNVTNCYTGHPNEYDGGATKRSLEDMQGADVLKLSTKMKLLGKHFQATEGYPVLDVFVENPDQDYEGETGNIWSGAIADDFQEGNGEEATPYLISNGAELALAVSSGGSGKHYKLTQDIYLNDVSVENWQAGSNVNQWVSGTFNGYINGDGHIIYGLYIPADADRKSSGLVGAFSGGKIEKLGIRNSYIYATHYAGGIAGQVTGSDYKEISMCFTDETVRVEFTDEVDGAAGGLVGYGNMITSDDTVRLRIINSYSKAAVISLYDQAFRANGIIGTSWKASFVIENCYSPFDAPFAASSKNNTSHLYMGTGSVFMPISDIFKNVYTAQRGPDNEFEHFTYIDKIANMKGEKAKEFMPGLDFENVFQTVENGTPKLKIFTQLDGADIEAERNTIFASGNGSKEDPYVIKTVTHLRNLITSQTTKGKYYSLANDIHVNDTTDANWTQNSPAEWYTHSQMIAFAGHFEGNGYSIYGLYSNTEPKKFTSDDTFSPTMRGTGLFPAVTGSAVIRNVHVRDSYLKGPGYVGAIVGHGSLANEGRATIVGCSADGSVSLYGESVGGIVGGGGDGVIINYCYFTGKILHAAPGRGNGMVGDLWKKNQEVANCYSVGYTNYRTIPNYILALYGTEKNEGTTALTKDQMTGENAKKYMTELDWEVWYVVDGKTPQLKVVPESKSILFTYDGKVGEPWSGLFAAGFAGGSGTAEDPYLIETPEQLAYLVAGHYSENFRHYKINADIKINDTSYEGWERNARSWFDDYLVFRGQLDGAGHIISGLYFDTAGGRAGLFPIISQCATIKRLGVVESTIINPSGNGKQSYSAAIVAYVHHWLEAPVENAVMPKISECFADDTVYIQGQYAGGIACGAPSPIEIENCFFTGNLSREDNGGGLLGNSWTTRMYPKITSSYCATLNRDMIGMGGSFNGAGDNSYNYVYVDGSKGNAVGVKALSMMWMRGNNAKEHMKGFDFNNVWLTVDGGTPVLRCFENSQKYSCRREPTKTEISFSTAGGSACASVFGYSGYTEIPKLPTPTREGYKFGGWYCFSELDVPFVETVFPDFNTVLHAKWVPVGFAVNFDGTLDDEYDYNSSVEHYKPGVKGYNPLNVHAGLKSMHTLPDAKEDALFLMNYEDVLEVGKEYTLYFWMSAGKDDTSGNVTILHAKNPQYDSEIVGYEVATEFSKLRKGQWCEYEYTFVANTPYLVFKTPAGVELFFDDMRVIPTGKDGEIGKLDNMVQGGALSNGNSIIIIISVAVIGLAAIATTVVVITAVRRKRRKS